MSKEEKTKARRPRARPTPIVIGAMEERMSALLGAKNDPIYVDLHGGRMLELIDELRRSLGGRTVENNEETP